MRPLTHPSASTTASTSVTEPIHFTMPAAARDTISSANSTPAPPSPNLDATSHHSRSASAQPSHYDTADEDQDDNSDDFHHHRARDQPLSHRPHAADSLAPDAGAEGLGSSPLPSTPLPPIGPRKTQLRYRARLVLLGHKRGVSAVKFSPDGKLIASCSADGTIKTWDARTGDHEHTFEGHLAGVSAISWSPDSRLIASGSDDKSIRLWDVTTGKAHPTPFLGHHNYIYSLAFSPKGNMLVSGSYDEAVFLWDVRAARVMRSLPAHSDPVGGVDFVRDGTLIVSCSGDGLIRIWDTATGQCLRTLVHEDNAPVVSVRFAPNGKYVLAWTLDSSVRLWNYVDGKPVKTYQGHKNVKYSLGGCFGLYDAHDADASSAQSNGVTRGRVGRSDSGSDSESNGADNEPPSRTPPPKNNATALVASGSEDGSVYLWDVVSKEVLQRLEGHNGVVLGVDMHPTDRSIVTCGIDRSVRIWRFGGSTDDVAADIPSATNGGMANGAATLTDETPVAVAERTQSAGDEQMDESP